MTELLQQLEASLTGRVAHKWELPTESQLHAVHAQLCRGIREQKRFRLVEIEYDNSPSNDTE